MLIWRRHRRAFALTGTPLALLQALFLVLSVELHNHGPTDEFTSHLISLLPSYLHHHHFAYATPASRTVQDGNCLGCRIEHTPRTPSATGIPTPRNVAPQRVDSPPAAVHVRATPLLPYRFRAPPSV
jgi:hypothetical protein